MADREFIPQADLKAGYLARKTAIDAAVKRVLESGRYILDGEVASFEREFAEFHGVDQAVAVANGTDALELCLRACGVGPGDAVLTVSHTAVATIAAIDRTGAVAVLVDIDAQRYTMSPESLDRALGDSQLLDGLTPTAVVAVHLYGQPAEMPALCDVARRHGLRVVEDCAQAAGARLAGRPVGTFGDVAAFSFYPTKNLAAFGDAGAVLTDDGELARRVRALRQYGWDEKRVSQSAGMNSRMDELQAAVLRGRLADLESDNQRRRDIAEQYTRGLHETTLRLPLLADGATHVYHQYVVNTKGRDSLHNFLAAERVGTAIHYARPVHLQPAYRRRVRCVGELRETESAAAQVLSLPMYPQLPFEHVEIVVGACRQWSASRPG